MVVPVLRGTRGRVGFRPWKAARERHLSRRRPQSARSQFRQTVVLLCEHGAEGALGVVVNRPTAMSVSEALPQVPVLEGQAMCCMPGGPVQTNQVMLLYRGDQLPDNSHHVFDGVCLGGDMEWSKNSDTSRDKEAFRAYLGYSGWGPGQLESEMRIGSWITVPADPAMVFEMDPTYVWAEFLSRWAKHSACTLICHSIPPATNTLGFLRSATSLLEACLRRLVGFLPMQS